MADNKSNQAQNGKNKRFSIYLTEDMARRIDDYRYSRRIAAHSQAVCELIEAGLKAFEEKDESAFFLGVKDGRLTIPDEPTERDLLVAKTINSLSPDVFRGLEAFLRVVKESEESSLGDRETEN